MQDCIACYQCRQKGKCVFDDQVNEIAARLDEFGGMIVGSPVYYGGPNGRLTSFLDRLFFSADGTKFRGMLAASVVSCRRGGATAAFERLNQYFLMTNMHVVSSQYWNQIHGFIAEEARQDEEGLQTMRTLGANMAYLLKAGKLLKTQGLPSLSTKRQHLRISSDKGCRQRIYLKENWREKSLLRRLTRNLIRFLRYRDNPMH